MWHQILDVLRTSFLSMVRTVIFPLLAFIGVIFLGAAQVTPFAFWAAGAIFGLLGFFFLVYVAEDALMRFLAARKKPDAG